MAINKIVYGNETLLDLTADTIEAADLAQGKTAHDKSGAVITGTSTKDADTSDATASASEILEGKTAYVVGNKIEGTMPNRAGEGGTITAKADEVVIRSGYHDGSGKVAIDSVEQAKIIAGNIKSGVNILGVEGSYSGEGGRGQSKTATPKTTEQTILPDAGYDFLTQVKVSAIAYVETPNASGTTVTIGTV